MPPAKVTIIIDTTGKDNGYNRANDMLKEYYDHSPTSLKPMTETLQEKVDRAEAEAELHRLGLWVPE